MLLILLFALFEASSPCVSRLALRLKNLVCDEIAPLPNMVGLNHQLPIAQTFHGRSIPPGACCKYCSASKYLVSLDPAQPELGCVCHPCYQFLKLKKKNNRTTSIEDWVARRAIISAIIKAREHVCELCKKDLLNSKKNAKTAYLRTFSEAYQMYLYPTCQNRMFYATGDNRAKKNAIGMHAMIQTRLQPSHRVKTKSNSDFDERSWRLRILLKVLRRSFDSRTKRLPTQEIIEH